MGEEREPRVERALRDHSGQVVVCPQCSRPFWPGDRFVRVSAKDVVHLACYQGGRVTWRGW